MTHPCHKHPRHITRREFLSVMGAAAATLAVSSCAPTSASVNPTAAPAAVKPLTMGKPIVALAEAVNYERGTVRKQVRALLDALGGLKGVVRSGDRVAIKTNLTGGINVRPLAGWSAIESYITHPEVVFALGEAVRDAGAKELYIVEAVYEDASWSRWGYTEIAKALDAKLIDLNSTRPYNDFAQVKVGDGAFIYQDFTFNHILQDVDVFMSVPKMKCHNSAGITLAMKNLVGLVPARFYRLTEQHNHRSALHGEGQVTATRLPRVIVDLNRARPINFALIDGIMTTEGGEGPWIGNMAAVQPHLLIAGADALATDTVATAAMGYDAAGAGMQEPFVRSDNHFAIAAQMGMGTNKLADITTIGPAIGDVKMKFKPSW